MSRPFTVTRAEARELKKRDEKAKRHGAVPQAVAHQRWLAELERELRALVRAYDGAARGAKKLLEALLVVEEEGVAAVAEIRHQLAEKMTKRRAA